MLEGLALLKQLGSKGQWARLKYKEADPLVEGKLVQDYLRFGSISIWHEREVRGGNAARVEQPGRS